MNRYFIPSLISVAFLLTIAIGGGFRNSPAATPTHPARFFNPPDSTKSDGIVSISFDCTKTHGYYTYSVSGSGDTHKVFISDMMMERLGPVLVLGKLVLEPLSSNPAIMREQLSKQEKVQVQVSAAILNQTQSGQKK